jgi:hypothetical protein
MFVVPYVLVTYVLFKSNRMYNILFTVLVCLFHGAGTGVGTVCHLHHRIHTPTHKYHMKNEYTQNQHKINLCTT